MGENNMAISAVSANTQKQAGASVSAQSRNTVKGSVFSDPLGSFEAMTEKAKSMRISEAAKSNKREDGVELVTAMWREMAKNGDPKTGEKYQELVKEFGSQYIQQLDKKYGNGDGVLTFDEYYKSEIGDIPADADKELVEEMKDSIKRAYNRLNQDGNDNIDAKEMTVLFAAMDYDEKNNVNGCITINDFMRTSVQLGAQGKVFLDDLLKYIYNSYFNKK